jgi:hypothetical protein
MITIKIVDVVFSFLEVYIFRKLFNKTTSIELLGKILISQMGNRIDKT